MILFDNDPVVLNGWAVQINRFLQERLSLHLHPNKTQTNLVQNGFDFIGFISKPGRTYLRQTSLIRCQQKIRVWEQAGSPMDAQSLQGLSDTVTSYLGMLRQVNGYRARRSLCNRIGNNLFIHADEGYTKIIPTIRESRYGIYARGKR